MIKVNKLDFSFAVAVLRPRLVFPRHFSFSQIHARYILKYTHCSVLPQKKNRPPKEAETETETSLAFCLFLGVRLFVIQD